MPDDKVACPQCSVTIRYQEKHRGRKVSCPKCQAVVMIPAPEDDGSAAPTALEHEPHANLCVRCGKKIKAGISKCKKCRAEVTAELNLRMQQQSAFDGAQASQAKFLAMKSSSQAKAFPHALHLLLVVVTFGVWAPFYVLRYRDWQSPDD